MKRLNDAYVEGVIKKAADGKMTIGQAAARLGRCQSASSWPIQKSREAEMDSAAGAPLEEIRSQAQKEVETNYLIMTGTDAFFCSLFFTIAIVFLASIT